jgi:hypothetical protein
VAIPKPIKLNVLLLQCVHKLLALQLAWVKILMQASSISWGLH